MNFHKTPWFLSQRFFSFFFGLVFTIILVSILVQVGLYVGGAYLLTKADWSKGILPPVERVLCGEPGCLKTYIQNQE